MTSPLEALPRGWRARFRSWSPWHLRRALTLIALPDGNRCERIVDGYGYRTCRTGADSRWSPDTDYLDIRWCDSCIAVTALDGLEALPRRSETKRAK